MVKSVFAAPILTKLITVQGKTVIYLDTIRFWQRTVKHVANFTHNPADVTNCTSELAMCSEINLAPDTRTSFGSYKT